MLLKSINISSVVANDSLQQQPPSKLGDSNISNKDIPTIVMHKSISSEDQNISEASSGETQSRTSSYDERTPAIVLLSSPDTSPITPPPSFNTVVENDKKQEMLTQELATPHETKSFTSSDSKSDYGEGNNEGFPNPPSENMLQDMTQDHNLSHEEVFLSLSRAPLAAMEDESDFSKSPASSFSSIDVNRAGNKDNTSHTSSSASDKCGKTQNDLQCTYHSRYINVIPCTPPQHNDLPFNLGPGGGSMPYFTKPNANEEYNQHHNLVHNLASNINISRNLNHSSLQHNNDLLCPHGALGSDYFVSNNGYKIGCRQPCASHTLKLNSLRQQQSLPYKGQKDNYLNALMDQESAYTLNKGAQFLLCEEKHKENDLSNTDLICPSPPSNCEHNKLKSDKTTSLQQNLGQNQHLNDIHDSLILSQLLPDCKLLILCKMSVLSQSVIVVKQPSLL